MEKERESTNAQGGNADPHSPPTTSARTEQWLRYLLAGHPEAERRVFTRHVTVLLAHARRDWRMKVIAQRACLDEDDVVQGVYRRVLASGRLANFEDRGPGALLGLLLDVLDKELFDQFRRCQAQRRTPPQARTGDVPVEASMALAKDAPPDAAARGRELLELCQRILPQREWEIWRLAEVEGLDSAAIATHFDMTPAAVRGVIHRARSRLMKALRRDEGAGPQRAGHRT